MHDRRPHHTPFRKIARGGWRPAVIVAALVSVAVVVATPAYAAKQQSVGGYVVAWPANLASGNTVAAGTPLSVTVRPTSPAPRRAALVEVIRLTASGKVKGVVARHRVRRRTVAIRPTAAAARYRVRVKVGHRSVSRLIRTLARVSAPMPGPPQPCDHPAGPSATLTADTPTLRAGETLSLTLRNTGVHCFRTGLAVILRHQDGTPIRFDQPPVPAILIYLRAGESTRGLLVLPTDLAPGVYRAGMYVSSGPENDYPPVQQEVAVDFTVIA